MINTHDYAKSWEELFALITKRGVVINLLAPFLLLAIGYVLKRVGIFPEYPGLGDETHNLMLYVFGAVALGELVVAFYLKKKLLHPSRFDGLDKSFTGFTKRCGENISLVFAVGAAPAIYGLVLYALGGTLEQFVFFILISLIGYRLLRPSNSELEKLWTDLGGAEVDG